MVIGMACDKEPKEELEMRPIIALRNSKPYNCLEVYEKNKREEMQHCGDFKYLLDYEKKILKWHEKAIGRPEVARYSIPCLELPIYLSKYYVVTKLMDKNYILQEAQKSMRLQFLKATPPAKTKEYFRSRDADFRYEKNIANYRQKMSKKFKKVTSEEEVRSIEDNQFLLYHRAMEIWESIQQQAQSNGDVTTPNGTDPKTLFPISNFSQILVDTPPLPTLANYDQLVKDVTELKKILRQQGKSESIEHADSDMCVAPSERASLFGYPSKWRRNQLYP